PAAASAVPVLEFGHEADPKTQRAQSWGIAYGIAPFTEGTRKLWLPAKVLHADGDRTETLAELATSPAESHKSYRLELSVASNRFSGAVNGGSVGSAAKPEGAFGYLVMRLPTWSEMTITGMA